MDLSSLPPASDNLPTHAGWWCMGLSFLHTDLVRLLRRLVTAAMLGVGAIFGRKTEREAHWSDPPNWIADAEADDAESGDP
jgi:hypothetical protein